MSKGHGKLAIKLMDILSEGNEYSYYLDMYELISASGALQPSVHRSLKRLIELGLVVTRKVQSPCTTLDQIRSKSEYILVDNLPLNVQRETEYNEFIENNNKLTQIEADRYGLSVKDYLMQKMVGNLPVLN